MTAPAGTTIFRVFNRGARIVDHPLFSRIILILILFNTVIIGMETYPFINDRYGTLLRIADQIILWIFTLEIILKLIAIKPTWHFFRDNWNTFDLLIIIGSHLLAGAPFVTVIRIVRVLRILRTVSIIPSLKKLTNALLMTLPSLGTISLLMFLIFYVFGVIGTLLYRDAAPEFFGSLHLSFLTLFQIITLDSWASGMMRPLFETAPFAWVYFISFVLVGTFVIFNLFVGVIVSNVERAEKEEKAASGERDEVAVELSEVRKELQELKEMIKNLPAGK
ncbi:ion transporter [Paenibacillaceae bacterium]|nr:ion transporter [Paenibacillaceae bacterium]